MMTLGALFRLLMAVVLIAGSVIFAPARGSVPPGADLVICSGAGERVITLDAQGNPVAPRHRCPDCLPGIVAFVPPDSAGVSLPPLVQRAMPRMTGVLLVAGRADLPAKARGPPAVI